MSAIHRALTDTDQRDSDPRSEFNPLQRAAIRSQRAWWWLSLVLVVAIVTVSAQRFWFGTAAETTADTSVQVATINPPTIEDAPQRATQTDATVETAAAATSPERSIEQAQKQPHPETTDHEMDRSPIVVTPTVLAESELPPAPQDQSANSQSPKEAQPAPEEPEPETVPDPVAAEPPVRTASTEPLATRATEVPTQPGRDLVTPSAPTYESRVQAAITDQDLPGARQLLQRWIREEPEHDVPRVWLARIYLAEDQLAPARGVLQGQRSIEARALIGLVHERTGEFQQAATLYETLAREDPGNEQWWLRWAINLENSGQLAQARNLYQTYLQVFPGQDSSLTRFAQQRYQSLEGQP